MLQTLVSRAFKVCCNDQDLKKEIEHINNRLRDINGYPGWIIEQTNEKVKNQNKMTRPTQITFNNEENEHSLMLHYKEKAGETRTKVFTEICHTNKYHVQSYLHRIVASLKI